MVVGLEPGDPWDPLNLNCSMVHGHGGGGGGGMVLGGDLEILEVFSSLNSSVIYGDLSEIRAPRKTSESLKV